MIFEYDILSMYQNGGHTKANADANADSIVFDNRYALSRNVEHHPPLPLYVLMNSSFWFDTINLGWSIVYIEGSNPILLKMIDR